MLRPPVCGATIFGETSYVIILKKLLILCYKKRIAFVVLTV